MTQPSAGSPKAQPPMQHRSRWQSLFTQAGVTLRSAPIGKQPRLLGSTPDMLTQVELLGDPRNLAALTIVAAMLPTRNAAARRNGRLLDSVALALGAPPLWLAEGLRACAAASVAANTSGKPYAQPPITLDIGLLLITLVYAPETCIVTLKAVNHGPPAAR